MARPPEEHHPFAEIGYAGLDQTTGYVREEWHPKLQGTQAVRVFKEMRDNDPIIGAVLYAFEHWIRSTTWKFEARAESPSPEEQRVADFVEECRGDMLSTWQEVLSEILTMLTFGYSLLEPTYKLRCGDYASELMRSQYADRAIGWRDMAPRAQETVRRWLYDDEGDQLLGVEQLGPPRYKLVPLPLSRVLHFRTKSHKRNPEGRSLLRNAYRPWYFLKKLQEIEAIGVERNVAGLPVVRLPPAMLSPSASPAQQAAVREYQKTAAKLRVDGYSGIVFPASKVGTEETGYDLQLMSSSGKSFADTDPIIRRYESRIALSVLGEFVLLGMDKVGSFALADNKTEFAALAMGAVMDGISEVFTRDAVPALLRANGIPLDLAPKLSHGDVEQADVNQLMAYVVQGVTSGAITPDGKLEAHLREYAALPPREAAEAMLGRATADALAIRGDEARAPTAEPPPGAETTAEISLNGAQIASLLAVIQDIAARRLPRESGVEIIRTSFQLDRARADALVGDVGQSFFLAGEP